MGKKDNLALNCDQIELAKKILEAERVRFIRKERKGKALKQLKLLEGAIQHLEVIFVL